MGKSNHNPSNDLRHCKIHGAVLLLGVASGVIYLFNFKLFRLVPGLVSPTAIHVYVSMFGLLSLLYLISVFLVIKNKSTIGRSKGLLCIIFIFAVVFRLCLIPKDPVVLSKDVYRFIWDGRVQQHGINPYRYAPADDALQNLRDEQIYPNINRKAYPTVYPAGAQFFFV